MFHRNLVFCWAVLFAVAGAAQEPATLVLEEVDLKWDGFGGIGSMSVSPDGKQIALGGTLPGRARHFGELIVLAARGDVRVGGLQLRNFDSGEVEQSATDLLGSVQQLVYSPDGKILAAACGDWNRPGQLILMDVATGTITNRLGGHAGWIRGITFSPDGQQIVTGGSSTPQSQVDGGEVWVWDVGAAEGRKIWTSQETVPASLAYSPDGRYFTSNGDWNVVHVWDAKTLQPQFELKNKHPSTVTQSCFSPDSKTLVTCNDQYGLHRARMVCWDIRQREAIHVEDVSKWWPDRRNVRFGELAISPDGKMLAVPLGSWNIGDKWAEVRLWNMAANELHPNIPISLQDKKPATSAVFSVDGQSLTVAVGRDTLQRWSIKN